MPKKSTQTPSARQILRDPVHFLAFGFGSGLSPKAPGTAGTVAAIPLFLLLQGVPLWAYLLITALVVAVGIWLCGESSRRLGVHDHPGIVWDEIAGFLITLIAAPAGWIWIIVGFALFRLFDILKPWPIGWLDKHLEGGTGIMLDDVLAGIYALIVLQALAWWLI
ncbi:MULTISPECIES: phosphatidylglycerophosphatase A [unclassified Ectothiorhodospira]|uniref:phosphatidylglycerophosphatase A family protein n=1 Tax=unclassified Ectothiorhodospira TaxID=2684909 RepID=UPI001EE9A715|nr:MULTISPECIES: phosphatidylglycerophosphatase A [unclassified Ectothiorhodospira]MCG5516866.1 phosphatidylglycerophosphatase A [Ectothiorhodospira sp. 9100]MCG5520389.1 phosphatidylglycerophosphatase A [Ectothiorhodospira sp. 9905]